MDNGGKYVSVRQKLREKLGNALPPELGTDFNLDRWLSNYDNDVDSCSVKFLEYLDNRRALGYDRPGGEAEFYSRNEVQKVHQFFHLGKLDPSWVTEDNMPYDSGIVFCETGVSNPNEVVKCIRVSEYAHAFFGYAECFQNLVLAQEKRTGKRSYGICLFDMQQMSMLTYSNPLAPINKMFESRIAMWLTYYGELLKHIIVVNPPTFLTVTFQVLRVLLPAKMINRFTFVRNNPHDIERHICFDAIPSCYRGGRHIETEEDQLWNGCNKQKRLEAGDFVSSGGIWKEHLPDTNGIVHEVHYVAAGSSYIKEFPSLRRGQLLLYEYFANRDYEITLRHMGDNGELILPRLKLSTPVLPEEGCVRITKNAGVVLEIKNVGKLLKLTLKIATHVI